LLICYKIRKTIYKIVLDKILDQTNYTNKVIYRFINDASKYIDLLFEKYKQKNI